ncbi:hypothetical protein K7432_007025 [Basidiobolus ranarum]|uniref:Hydantoin racemase n=1 Tax=Basidiobolus ranarum TaxID=34480 RepID=A0ABR2WU51_9FUNG
MSKILIINPNTSQAFTTLIERVAKDVLKGTGIDIEATSPTQGPMSIESMMDEVVSAYWTIDHVIPRISQYDGFIVACYSAHPSIPALREYTEKPVIGIMEGSIYHSLPLGEKFSIVTTAPRWKPLLEEGVRNMGLKERCASERTSGLAVMELEQLDPDIVIDRLCQEARRAVDEDGAEVIVLGCAGMAGLEQAVYEATRVPVVDGVRASVEYMAGLVRSKLKVSKRLLYSKLPDRPHEIKVPDMGVAMAYGAKQAISDRIMKPFISIMDYKNINTTVMYDAK